MLGQGGCGEERKGVSGGLEGPFWPAAPRVGMCPTYRCLARHLPESHPGGQGGHGNCWLHSFPYTHAFQVVLLRATRPPPTALVGAACKGHPHRGLAASLGTLEPE